MMINETAVGHCSVCERPTWNDKDIGKKCKLIQPNQTRCTGVFRKWKAGRVKTKNEHDKVVTRLHLQLEIIKVICKPEYNKITLNEVIYVLSNVLHRYIQDLKK